MLKFEILDKKTFNLKLTLIKIVINHQRLNNSQCSFNFSNHLT